MHHNTLFRNLSVRVTRKRKWYPPGESLYVISKASSFHFARTLQKYIPCDWCAPAFEIISLRIQYNLTKSVFLRGEYLLENSSWGLGRMAALNTVATTAQVIIMLFQGFTTLNTVLPRFNKGFGLIDLAKETLEGFAKASLALPRGRVGP